MPMGKPMGYINKGMQAIKGSDTAKSVVNSRAGQFAKRRPVITAMGAMGVAGGVASGRRRSGLDKVQGRPTGIYGY